MRLPPALTPAARLSTASRAASLVPRTLMIAALATLPGCGALSALQGEPERDLFELRAPTELRCTGAPVGELVIEPPKTRGTLDSDRIMIRPSALQTQYLPDAQWGDTVPAMLQRLLVESLGATGAYTHVGRAPLGLSGDLAMISDINDFNVAMTGDDAVVMVTIDAQLIGELKANVISRASFTASVPAASTRTADLIPAFDAGTRQVVGQMTEWGLRASGVGPARCR